MSQYFKQIHNILESNGENYEALNPEIKSVNVFSISTLAHGSASQVYWKIKGQKGQFPYESNVGKAFFLGRSVHEFVQSRMKDFLREFKIQYLTEGFQINSSGFMLDGHIDLIDLSRRYIIELKTTKEETVNLGRIREYMLQVGAYAKIMELQTGFPFRASVFVINGTLTEYELTKEDIDNSFKVILERANKTLEELKVRGKIPNGKV